MPDGLSLDGGSAGVTRKDPGASRWLPATSLGWWVSGLTVAFLIFVPTMIFLTPRFVGTVLDTWVTPTFFVVWIDAAAVIGLLAIVRRRERGVLPIAATVVAMAVGIFATLMAVGEALGPQV